MHYPSTHPSFSQPPPINHPLIHPLSTYQSPTHLSIRSSSIHPSTYSLSVYHCIHPPSIHPPILHPSPSHPYTHPPLTYHPSIYRPLIHPLIQHLPLSFAPGQPLVPHTDQEQRMSSATAAFSSLLSFLPASLSVLCVSYGPRLVPIARNSCVSDKFEAPCCPDFMSGLSFLCLLPSELRHRCSGPGFT